MKKKTTFIGLLAFAFFPSLDLNAQFSLSGKVITANGEPVPFSLLGIHQTQLNTSSGIDGAYDFQNLKNGKYIISAKCVGYLSVTDTVIITEHTQHNFVLTLSSKNMDEVVVNATRVNNNQGMAYNSIDAQTIQKQNLGQDAPYVLNLLPNVVVNSDAGNGFGYTGLRIRGSDGTRINVTINGVPVNDAESQGTFFVDMPDLVSSVNNIQVQRGVGASSNGAGAFGASINFQTNELKDKPYANLISSGGSYGTLRNTLAAGTGLLNSKFTLDARASAINSDGYIDRASSHLRSYYIAGGFYGKKTVVKFINFLGVEKTYQAWNYVPQDSIKAGNRTYNSAGEYIDENGNTKYYANETDNYKQNNFQLHIIHQVSRRLNFSLTGHYTKGEGYYEQYKNPAQENLSFGNGALFSTYNLPNVVIGGDTITETNLVRRLWLDNDFAGGIFNLNYNANSKLGFTLGGAFNRYFGLHYGQIIWAQYASTAGTDYTYDRNSADKTDGNVYLKINYKPISNLNVFADLQLRNVNYQFLGFNDSLVEQMQKQSYNFFNPKAGCSYNLNTALNIYASIAVANKEPNRNDFVQSSSGSRPLAEQLIDVEAGLKYIDKKMTFAANFYNMHYNNQLVLNGEINDVGSYNRVNVGSSFRRGVELEADVFLNKYFAVFGNLALSQNKILNFTEFTDSLSGSNLENYTQNKISHSSTDISFSPDAVASITVRFTPIKNLDLSLTEKHVGKHYLDNTTNESRIIAPYQVLSAGLNYRIVTKLIPEINIMCTVNNLLNAHYETNGYTYSYYTGANLNTFNFLAPAAPLNFLVGLNLKF